MNLLQFSQIPRYKLARQNTEDGWGRSIVYTDLLADDRGEWMRVSDVRNLVVDDRPRPDVAALVEALEFIAKSVHPQVNGTGVVFRNVDGRDWRNWLEAAERLLAAHRKGGGQ